MPLIYLRFPITAVGENVKKNATLPREPMLPFNLGIGYESRSDNALILL